MLPVTAVPASGEDMILVNVPELDVVTVDMLIIVSGALGVLVDTAVVARLVTMLGGPEESISPPVEAVVLEAVSASNLAILLSSKDFHETHLLN